MKVTVERMERMPVGLRVRGRPVLVIGGGAVALRKILLLRRCGANVTVVSPGVRAKIARLASARKITHRRAEFRLSDILRENYAMVFVCTDSPRVNAAVAGSLPAADRVQGFGTRRAAAMPLNSCGYGP